MGTEPATEEDWDHFHFPSKQELLAFMEHEDSHRQYLNSLRNDKALIGHSQMVVGLEEGVLEGGWEFQPSRLKLVNHKIARKLELRHFQTSDKVVRYLSIVRNRSDLDPLSLERELNRALKQVFGLSLQDVIDSPGTILDWAEPN